MAVEEIRNANIKVINIPQSVTVRKYPVDCERLGRCLREHKGTASNKAIATALGVPVTKVEHWFRKDKYFAIPDAEDWMNTKELLNIKTDEFDESIMTFEVKENRFEKANRVYGADGVAPTLTRTDADIKIIQTPIIGCTEQGVVVRNANKKGYDIASVGDSINLEQPNSKTRSGRVGHGVAQTLNTACNQGTVEIAEPLALDEQNRRIHTDGTVGTIMTDGSSPKHNNRVIEPVNPMPDGTCRTIKNQYYKTSKANFERTSTYGATGVKADYRIRKLTPKECFRLMGFADEDFEKCTCSNTQLYRQAGNSIVVNVAEQILSKLFDEDGNLIFS